MERVRALVLRSGDSGRGRANPAVDPDRHGTERGAGGHVSPGAVVLVMAVEQPRVWLHLAVPLAAADRGADHPL
ncbi:hypothetical protein D3C76_1243380 [compost metagenome]